MIFRVTNSRTRMNARPRGCCVNKVYGVFGWRKAGMVFVFSMSIRFLLSVYTLRINQVKGRYWKPTGPVQTEHASTRCRKPVQSHRDWTVAVGCSVVTRWCRYKKTKQGKRRDSFFFLQCNWMVTLTTWRYWCILLCEALRRLSKVQANKSKNLLPYL